MEKLVIARGALAGAIAGLIAYVFARIMVEPIIGRAIGIEEARSAAEHAAQGHDHGEETEIFSRAVQQNVGLGLGLVLFGIAMGAIFAVTYCVAAQKVPQWTPRALALAVAGSLFAGFYAIPFVKYAPNPPAIGDPDTIRERTGVYLLMVAIALALVAAAWVVALAAAPRVGGVYAALIGGAIVVIGAILAYAILPAPAATPDQFPADDLFDFRIYSFLAQAIIWGGTALIGGELLQRLTQRQGSPVAVAA